MFEYLKTWWQQANNKVLTTIVATIEVAACVYAMQLNTTTAKTFEIVLLALVIGVSTVFLAEKLLFPGWKINEEIKKNNIAAGLVVVAIAIVVSSIISGLFK